MIFNYLKITLSVENIEETGLNDNQKERMLNLLDEIVNIDNLKMKHIFNMLNLEK